jgi:hypothetical protein
VKRLSVLTLAALLNGLVLSCDYETPQTVRDAELALRAINFKPVTCPNIKQIVQNRERACAVVMADVVQLVKLYALKNESKPSLNGLTWIIAEPGATLPRWWNGESIRLTPRSDYVFVERRNDETDVERLLPALEGLWTQAYKHLNILGRTENIPCSVYGFKTIVPIKICYVNVSINQEILNPVSIHLMIAGLSTMHPLSGHHLVYTGFTDCGPSIFDDLYQ